MFPWGRGLLNSFWAPNFWAIYAFADKFLSIILQKFYILDNSNKGTTTSGVV